MAREVRFGDRVVLDFCGFGTPWKKSTSFVFWNYSSDVSKLGVRCGNQKICRFSGECHRILEGGAPGGMRWTKIAEPYPMKLCYVWAGIADRHYDWMIFRRNFGAASSRQGREVVGGSRLVSGSIVPSLASDSGDLVVHAMPLAESTG